MVRGQVGREWNKQYLVQACAWDAPVGLAAGQEMRAV